ncbi:MAG: helicase-exonuclease AddAB subunit AddA [Clostridia bacterium]
MEKLKYIQSQIQQENLNTWDTIYELTNDLQFDKWPIDKKITIGYKEEAKQIRDTVKKNISKEIKKILLYNSKQANADLQSLYPTLVSLKTLILDFAQAFQIKKKEKNIIDFHDIEHFALKILLKEENGQFTKTPVAIKQQEKYEEIAIDEYQDSNMVQEYILNSIARGNNLFMVGDVKQSIYKFRQARPELFLEKYQQYEPIVVEEKKCKKGRKIQLYKNFRSRQDILSFTNFVFSEIMSQSLGDIDYTKEEYLNLGANYEKPEEGIQNYAGKTQIHIVDLAKTEESEEENEVEDSQIIENTVLEAKFVAGKIKELIESHFQVWDKKQNRYRNITYKDIVILLRATSNAAPIYEKELSEQNFPVFSDTSAQYLESTEIQTILSILKIMDNPLQDIPLVTFLRSPIGNFTDNDLVEIRLADTASYFYYAMLKARISANKLLREKIDRIMNWLEKWKQEEKEKPLEELIWQIYLDTNYYHYVGLLSNGALRQANLKMLFEKAKQYETANFKGLFQFINFMDKVRTSNKDMTAAKIIGENEDVIRIMSIHKSKGLEFPVVFLCGTGKKFNMQDLNQNILLHQDMGFGPNYRNANLPIEYPTLAKEAIRIQTKTETIAEEMRVLYVALTRAKEKLYITGVAKDWEKSIEEKTNLLEMDKQENMDPLFLKKYPCYLDWITLLSLKHKEAFLEVAQMYIHPSKEISIEEKQEQEENLKEVIEKQEKPASKKIKEIADIVHWSYGYKTSIEIPTKTSVTYIKAQKQQEKEIKLVSIEELQKQIEEPMEGTLEKNYKEVTLLEPKFKKEEIVTPARKGTLIHMCIQQMNETKNYTKEGLKQWLQELVDKEFITEQEARNIPISILYQYTQSTLWKNLKKAKEIHKEEPFYTNLLAKEIYSLEPENNEKILVQGMIDLYYIDENDKLILVDYKTDYVEEGKEQELLEKYKEQLMFYKQALEEALNQKVDRVEIYSTYLQKSIAYV